MVRCVDPFIPSLFPSVSVSEMNLFPESPPAKTLILAHDPLLQLQTEI